LVEGKFYPNFDHIRTVLTHRAMVTVPIQGRPINVKHDIRCVMTKVEGTKGVWVTARAAELRTRQWQTVSRLMKRRDSTSQIEM